MRRPQFDTPFASSIDINLQPEKKEILHKPASTAVASVMIGPLNRHQFGKALASSNLSATVDDRAGLEDIPSIRHDRSDVTLTIVNSI